MGVREDLPLVPSWLKTSLAIMFGKRVRLYGMPAYLWRGVYYVVRSR